MVYPLDKSESTTPLSNFLVGAQLDVAVVYLSLKTVGIDAWTLLLFNQPGLYA